MQDTRPNPTLCLEYRADRPIFSDFLQQEMRSPDAPAIIGDGLSCSYRQLQQISHGIAGFLRERGGSSGDRVLIVCSRGAGLVYAMLGALRAGLPFTVVDVAYPAARIAQLVDSLEPAFILCCGEAQVAAPGSAQVVRVPELPARALLQFPEQPKALPEVDPAAPAYITFTSGSTGTPKGVVTHHAPLVHFIEWHVRRHGFSEQDRFSLLSGLGHDPVYRDIFTPLSIGATVVCPAQSTLTHPAQLAAWIASQGVSVIHLTPPLGKLIATGAGINQQRLEQVRWLFWGGDALSPALYQTLRTIAPNATSVNFYGTTETPQAMVFHQLDTLPEQAAIPLGKGIDGAQVLVVGDHQQLVGEGEVGEILIRSPYLSLGYWRDPVLSAEKFVANPFTAAQGDTCYRTGDLGSYLPDGSVAFLGRADCQVKIRGHRIELAEIESVIARLPQIEQCVVVASTDSAAPRLIAYCVAHSAVACAQLREAVAGQLPDYMVPALFVFIEAIPLTPNGKIDRRALPAPTQVPAGNGHEALTPLAQKLADAWARILQVPHIDANLSFVELGGDSLSFVQASTVLEELVGQLPPRWELMPVKALAELAGKGRAPRHALRAMEMPVLMRMLSILLIVMGHLGVLGNGMVMGETTALFLVSGLGLARFQVNAINERGDARSLIKSMLAIALPTLLYTALVQGVFDQVHWQSLLLISNWFPAEAVGHFSYWYIEVLVQMVLIIGLVLSIKPVRQLIMANPFRHLLLAACALLVADLALSRWVFDATALYNRVPQHYLAAMVLGMAVQYADTTRRKWLASAVAVVVVGELELVTIAGYGWDVWLSGLHIDIALPAVLALIWCRSVPVPAAIARGGALIASSTLFIYLTHYQFQSVARRISDQPLLAVVLAIVGGVLVAYCWNLAIRLALKRWSRARRKRLAQALEPAA
ncbi:amino acid adenylation domain-containing protein [Pseudomonas sp. KU43P]|uniref:amino acid adenylation domain-containing protein n=1 Tax=Pseudomonas sp. KU43P TaxID=2487887 RepID=UPI0012AA90B1|nr:amino acid adenylation domain-containing protein [Pseudomonas sp. KU43P]BBH46320.1 hypothetical protein KU43P_27970 [Pseudomonas sp. KU43P]